MNKTSYVIQIMQKNFNNSLGRVYKEIGLQLDRAGSRITNDISYLQPLSRHRQVMPVYDTAPYVKDSWIA